MLQYKNGPFQKLFGALADRFSSKRKIENSLVTPINQLTSKLNQLSDHLASQSQKYEQQMNGEIPIDRPFAQTKSSILAIIENGRQMKNTLISKLASKVQAQAEQTISKSKTQTKAQPATGLNR